MADQRAGRKRHLVWDLATFSGVAAGIAIVMTKGFTQVLEMLPGPIALCYLGVLRGRIGHFICTRPALVIIGGMCYTIYLYHVPLLHQLAPRMLAKWGSSVGSCLIQMTLYLAALFVVSALLFAFVERPFMRRDWAQTVGAFFGKIGRRFATIPRSAESEARNSSDTPEVLAPLPKPHFSTSLIDSVNQNFPNSVGRE